MKTADGYEVTDGMRVWTSDLDAGIVDLSRDWGDGWFDVRLDSGGRSMINGERIAVRHPFTGAKA